MMEAEKIARQPGEHRENGYSFESSRGQKSHGT